jgi:hypothetical protein
LNQGATIFSNDPQDTETKISITASVKQHISIEPSTKVLLQGYYGDKITQEVTIVSLEEQALNITNITSDIDSKIKYKLKTVKNGKKFGLEIKTRSGLKDSFQGKVTLETNSQKKPKLELSVMGKVQKEIKVTPQSLYFGIIDTKMKTIDPKSLERTVMVSVIRGDDIIIEKIEASSDWIMAEKESTRKGEEYTIIIKLDRNKLPKGEFKEKITIHTKNKKISEVADVIIEGKVL